MFNLLKYKPYLYLYLKTFCKFLNDRRKKSLLLIQSPELCGRLHKQHVLIPCSHTKESQMEDASQKDWLDESSMYTGCSVKKKSATINEVNNINLNEDFEEFEKILWANIEALFDLLELYYSTDETFRIELEKLAESANVTDLVNMICNMPEFKEFTKFLKDNGLKGIGDYERDTIQGEINTKIPSNVKDNLFKRSYNNEQNKSPTCDTGLKGFVEAVKKTVDINRLQNLYNEKLETSESFQKLVQYLKCEKFLVIVNVVKADKNFQNIVQCLIECGIDDIQYIGEVLNKHLGW